VAQQAEHAALQVFAAINSGDFTGLDELVTADFVDHGSPLPIEPGPAGYRDILTFVHHVLQYRYEVKEVFSTADRVVVRAEASAVGVAALHGPEAAGRPYRITTLHLYRTEGGRLAEHWGVRDDLSAFIQLGVIAPPDPAAFVAR
jgi:ketosteroid isomerase-like protein